ncbi:TUFTELIN-INTERACTING PROTEIN 11-RELATED domain containing protein, putative [Babesia bigemina]|uniref:TUFTELIN-INTERACTING PROTEIN 11-RELATED domain containing protein, putative n=1 Tax=Babesia bigemina TaxID=5866 RepID=A0A061D9P8_BABBI|nr:TUFTELIN-INTERACTING PROTEIN 11-RELATED domain containing protein, putative [Babesia bigemina]CDR94455.1 TUFTELIN-INTERACTING PROTEIN 11-RELATED domain containing protein, putative [Babesia bigemina]|eukprot:XP_012766641.1 TUFTELIN-INTERACTING PROTEIN 11-RELATED domain containing protein, putative [Babesia bigemina]
MYSDSEYDSSLYDAIGEGSYSNRYASGGRRPGGSAFFVKGGTLNMDEDHMTKSGHKGQSTKGAPEEDSDEGVSDTEDASMVYTADTIDRLLADGSERYAKEGHESYEDSSDDDDDDDDDYGVRRASSKMKRVDTGRRHRYENSKRDQGITYDADDVLQPRQIDKMYGKGVKMLKKMGYTGGGLGRDGTGVVAPIDLKAPVDKRGMHKDRDSSTLDIDYMGRVKQPTIRAVPISVNYSNAWRKKKVFRSKHEKQLPASTVKIPEVDQLIKALADKVQWFSEKGRQTYDAVEKAKGALTEAERELQEKESELTEQVEIIEVAEKALPRFMEFFQNVDNAFINLKDTTNVEVIIPVFENFVDRLFLECDADSTPYCYLGVQSICDHYFMRGLHAIYADWDIAKKPDLGARLVQSCLAQVDSYAYSSKTQAYFDQIIEPKLRKFFSEEWNVADTDVGKRCYKGWSSVISLLDGGGFKRRIAFESPLEVKLVNVIHEEKTIHLSHILVHPFLSSIGMGLSERTFVEHFVSAIMRMISKYVVSDVDKCLKPIKSWDRLLRRHDTEKIIQHVVRCLQNELKNVAINPQNQDTSVLQNAFLWMGYIGKGNLSEALCCDFMRRWLKVLKDWVMLPTANYDEVIIWYQGWKSFFPEEVIKTSAMESFLKDALREMDRASRNVLNAPTPQKNRERSPEKCDSKSIMNSVQKIGAMKGVVLIKRRGKTHNGKQVYAFGSASVIFDDCVMVINGNEARPISLYELEKLI